MMSTSNKQAQGNPVPRRKNQAHHSQLKDSRLRKQMSDDIRYNHSSGTLGTPNINKPKAALVSSNASVEEDLPQHEY